MNYAEKMRIKAQLQENIAGWMIAHGTVLSDRERSNEYTGVRIVEVRWRGAEYTIVQVDGETCQIEQQ